MLETFHSEEPGGVARNATRITESVQIKLRLPPENAGRLPRSALHKSLLRGRGETTHLRSVYFDTPRLDLKGKGASLCIQYIGQSRFQVLTLPLDGKDALQLFREIEVHFDFDSDVPGPLTHANEEIETFFRTHGIADDWIQVFTTTSKRTAWPVSLHGSEIAIALDAGEIMAGSRIKPIGDLTLRLQSGLPEHLFELALLVHHAVGTRWDYDTDPASGYRFAADEKPLPERAHPTGIDANMSGRAAFKSIAQSCLRQLRANEACARLGEDAEGVHQFRVGLRRLRTLVGACRKQIAPEFGSYLAEGLDWLQTQSGDARDWDVLLSKTLQRLHMRLPDDPSIEAIVSAAAAQRDASYATLRIALGDPRYTELLLRLQLALTDGTWSAVPAGQGPPLDLPASEFAARILRKQYKKLHAIHGVRGDLAEEEMHRLRVSSKKLRYLAEFFRSLYPKRSTKSFIDALVDVQDCLGSLNDSVVGRQLAKLLEGRIKSSADHGAAMVASGLILGWQAACADRAIDEFKPAWRRLRRRSPHWAKEAR